MLTISFNSHVILGGGRSSPILWTLTLTGLNPGIKTDAEPMGAQAAPKALWGQATAGGPELHCPCSHLKERGSFLKGGSEFKDGSYQWQGGFLGFYQDPRS